MDTVRTHPKGDENPLPLHHMGDSPGNMDNPCSDWLERFVEDVYLTVYVRNKNPHGRGCNRRDFEWVLDSGGAAKVCLMGGVNAKAARCVP